MNKTPIVIVAAGASRRLGTPKQLVPWRGKPLLQHTIDVALAANVGPVHLVLGAASERILAEVEVSQLYVHLCADWEAGMGASIACGVRAVMALEGQQQDSPKGQQIERAAALVLTVGDQPHLTAAHLRALHRAEAPVVVSRYAEGMGPPTRFGREAWPDLCKLSGDEGARRVVADFRARGAVMALDFALGYIDIDTPEDARRFLRE